MDKSVLDKTLAKHSSFFALRAPEGGGFFVRDAVSRAPILQFRQKIAEICGKYKQIMPRLRIDYFALKG